METPCWCTSVVHQYGGRKIVSVRSKRFCGVWEQRITARNMERVKEGGFFGSRPIFRAGKTPKIPFLGLYLLPNPTETLATQARK